LPKACEIDVLEGHIFVADHFQKLESACVPDPVAWAQRPEQLAGRSILVASGNGDEHAGRMIAQRCRETRLLLGGLAGPGEVGRAEMRDQLRRQPIDDIPAISFVRFDDLHQRRAAEGFQTQKAGSKCGARLAL
jgi:hypothetical protein